MIRTLNQLKDTLMRKSSWGYEIVHARNGQIRVYLHRKEYAYMSSFISDLLAADIKPIVEFKKQSRFWDLKMWWRSL